MNIKMNRSVLGLLSDSSRIVALLLISVMLLSVSPSVDASVEGGKFKSSIADLSSDPFLKASHSGTDTKYADNRSLYPKLINEIAIVAANMPTTSELLTENKKVAKEIFVQTSAYTSRVEETDSTPFTTAWNTQVRHGVVASNFLPFGTKLLIPDYYGDYVFTVEDRMNKRYTYNMDIWFADLQEAREFGRRTVRVQILES